MAVAETAAETGPASVVAIPATIAAIAGGMAAVGFSGAFGNISASNYDTKMNNDKTVQVSVNVDPITGRVTSNSNHSNIQTNVGRGGE